MKVNVSVIVVRKGEILLMQRSQADDYYPGAWGIPGGNMEPCDGSLEAVAIREVKEEVGLEIVPTNVLFNNNNVEMDCLYVVYGARLKNDDDYPAGIVLSDEAHDARWTAYSDVEGLSFTPFTKSRLNEVYKKMTATRS